MALTWYQEQFGVCAHGRPSRNYCATCVLEDEGAEQQKGDEKRVRAENARLKQTVAAQSAALHDAQARTQRLQKRLSEVLWWRRNRA